MVWIRGYCGRPQLTMAPRNPRPATSKPDRALRPGKDPQQDVYVHNRGTGWWLYFRGYKLAADALVEQSGQLTLGERNSILYPVLFLYRHYFELVIKYIILVGQKLRRERPQVRRRHCVVAYWGECKRVIRERKVPVTPKTLDRIGRLASELDALDPSSDRFRYPIDRDGSFPYPDERRRFNLEEFARAVSPVAAALEQIAGLLDADLDLEMEFYDDVYGQEW